MIRTFDMFCGAGGSSAGAHAAGAEIVVGIDRCNIAAETFAANYPEALVIADHLESVDIASLKAKINDIDLLLASPECTNHTCAKGGAPRNEKSRATAMMVINYAKELRPRWLVLENVIHMRSWSRYSELKSALTKLGYSLHEHVLDSADFGVAQRRRRIFLVGDLVQAPPQQIRKRRGRKKSVRSVLDPPETWATTALFHERRATATLERAARGFRKLGPNADFLLVYYGNDGAGGWQPLNRPLRTITTVDRFALISHDRGEARLRMLQVPEIKRAMGFNENFRLPVGTRRDRIRMLGNGVCPPVMKEIVTSLISQN